MSKRKSNIPTSVRAAVLERDGGKCRFCGTTFNLTLHHVIHREHDGPSTFENLLTLCRGHHNLVHSNVKRYQPICKELLANTTNLGMKRMSPKPSVNLSGTKPTQQKEQAR